MTVNMQSSILQINRAFLRVNSLRCFHLFRICCAKFTDPGLIASVDGDVFMEDRLEAKINQPYPVRPGQDRKKKFTRKELELQQRRFVKRKIIQKKENALYAQKQPRLLTWAAQSQIKYLHASDPIYWTPDMLALSFPVTREGVIAILKKNHIAPDEEFIHEYDRSVYMNWLRLKQAKQDLIKGRPVDPEFRSLVESETLNLMRNAAGSLALPVPDTGYLQITQKAIAEKRRPKTKGEFSAILEDYEKDKETVKTEKKTRRIELEDPDYVALLTGLSGQKTEDDFDEENSYQEHVNESKYKDEKLFYDEYDDNVLTDADRWDDDVRDDNDKHTFMTKRDKITNNKKIEFDNETASYYQKQRIGKRNSNVHHDKETDFQKNIAEWIKESCKNI